MSADGVLNGLFRLVMVGVVIGAGALGANAVLDRMSLDGRAAERRALLQRNAELNVGAIAPGSVLACLVGGAGEAIENACEKQVFADPKSAAAAVAYTAARLSLLADAYAMARNGEPAILDAVVGTRRALELDRYGLAAHVLATRDGCTPARCPGFVWLRDATAVKANLQAQSFNNYVARYASAWNKTEPEKVPVAAAPAAPVANAEPPSGVPVASKYDFPSSASIPPVSIMNSEPALPKAAAEAQAKGEPKPEVDPAVPVPPKRPQAQAATPPAR